MSMKVTPQKLARIDAWYAFWRLPRKTMAAQLGVSVSTLMAAAKREGGYGRLHG